MSLHILQNPPLAPRPGVYEHFKGGKYKVEAGSLEMDADTTRWRVRYFSLDHGVYFTRLYSDFHAVVPSTDGVTSVPRFRYLSDLPTV